jgi:voltage-gated potassium channel
MPITGQSDPHSDRKPLTPWRQRLHTIIFEAETPVGKAFDVLLLWAILLSVVAVLLESVSSINTEYGSILRAVEWGFTIAFTVEYLLRLISVSRAAMYARSFFGIVDLLAILPTYLSVVLVGTQSLLVIRAIRLLRVFRVLKLSQFMGEANILLRALKASRPKIVVFVGAVLTLVLVIGAAMYMIEGEQSGFSSIPRGIYWAIVTMTTVGYGDIAPITTLGQSLAAVVMIMGYAIIAVPTGIVSVELAQVTQHHANTIACPHCGEEGHDLDAIYCRICGGKL